jgi:two-component system cell cycle sensor histidine kinase PleC
MDLTIILISFYLVLGIVIIYLVKRLRELKKQIQETTLASRAKSLFMHKLAYEFRNPLNGIVGFTEMLESGFFGELSPIQQERIHDIYICGAQLENLIKDLIDLSKGESGNIEMIETSAPLSTIVDNAIKELKTKIESHRIRILMDLGPNDFEIRGDYKKLVQVFKNVIENAVKFSSRGGQVTIKQSNLQGKYLKVSIADSGMGISPEELSSIFLLPDDIRKTKSLNNGLGMGLPLARLFLNLHGCLIEVDSEEKLGTTVTICIPETRLKHISI